MGLLQRCRTCAGVKIDASARLINRPRHPSRVGNTPIAFRAMSWAGRTARAPPERAGSAWRAPPLMTPSRLAPCPGQTHAAQQRMRGRQTRAMTPRVRASVRSACLFAVSQKRKASARAVGVLDPRPKLRQAEPLLSGQRSALRDVTVSARAMGVRGRTAVPGTANQVQKRNAVGWACLRRVRCVSGCSAPRRSAPAQRERPCAERRGGGRRHNRARPGCCGARQRGAARHRRRGGRSAGAVARRGCHGARRAAGRPSRHVSASHGAIVQGSWRGSPETPPR